MTIARTGIRRKSGVIFRSRGETLRWGLNRKHQGLAEWTKTRALSGYMTMHSHRGRTRTSSEAALWPVNYAAIKNGEWPEYYIGSYPYCFKIPRFLLGSGYKMGQAPGTHWYHSHKHGSTSLNMFNGMSGALIIEDNRPTDTTGS